MFKNNILTQDMHQHYVWAFIRYHIKQKVLKYIFFFELCLNDERLPLTLIGSFLNNLYPSNFSLKTDASLYFHILGI